ncbi:MAG: haloacid dehalogenase [Anaerolineae bacterium]
MKNLDTLAEKILAGLDAKNAAREEALRLSRLLVQHASRTIRAVHRYEWDEAERILGDAQRIVESLKTATQAQPELYAAGYAQDALKEYAEAHITRALALGQDLPDPDDLGVEYPAYLNGLGEAIGEMRRHSLDVIRRGDIEHAERLVEAMDEVYAFLTTVDYPDAVTNGLRRTTDMVRGVTERTRGDLTTAARQEKLQAALRDFERRLETDSRE